MAKKQLKTNNVYCGDNLVMLKQLPDNCIDLIYIDPPFNSNRSYEIFWGDKQERRAFEDRFGDANAYINYMRPRIVELHRVLKPTGSFYYHCDWHAGHYIKIMLDQIFDFNCFRNEIVWKRSDTHNDAKKQYAVVSDSIFFYTKSDDYTFNIQYTPHNPKTLKEWYLFLEFPDGTIRKMTKEEIETQTIPAGARRFNTGNASNPTKVWEGGQYIYKGYNHPEKGWRYSLETMKELDKKGLLIFPKNKDGRIMRKRFLDEQKGIVLGNMWYDIDHLRAKKAERLGYPTQKPLALLQRILETSSNENDIVLDAFCGCGTTLAAAQGLGRKWLGIDIAPTACRVVGQRLGEFYQLEDGKDFEVIPLYKSEHDLLKLPPFEFQDWACIALGAIPNKRKVNDYGIDGKLYPTHIERKKENHLFANIHIYYPVQVKQKNKAGRPDIDSFAHAMRRDFKTKGYFIAFDFSEDAKVEIKRLEKEEKVQIIAITVEELLRDEK